MENTKIKWNSNLYEKKHAFVYKYGEQLIEFLAPKSNEKILDLGCGTGQLTSLIKKSGAEVIGIDNSLEMISSARKNFTDINFQIQDATAFNFHEELDGIFSNAVLHWVNEPEKAIECMYRSLKPGGRIVVEFGGKGNTEKMLTALSEAFIKKGLVAHSKIKFWFFPSIGQYSSLLEQIGFQVSYASLFDRFTELNENENSMKDWFKMFGEFFFKDLKEETKEEILDLTQEILRSSNYKDKKWYADYKRLRIIAFKPIKS